MAKFNKCPDCGANLDPGEACEDCKKKAEKEKNKTKDTKPDGNTNRETH